MLWALSVLAPFSLIASDVPRGWAWALALLAGAYGFMDARHHARQAARSLVVPAGRGEGNCDGERMDGLEVAWRGPLAFFRWRDAVGRMRRLSFWPDTLDAGMRRELRIAMQRRDAASDAASMAG